jgi:putative ABC transport system ATP-binding protein
MTTGETADNSIQIRARGLKRAFGQANRVVHVLRGLDFDASAGELVALLGPSGSGKTTLLNLIGGLDEPDAGSIEVCHHNLRDMSEEARASLRRSAMGFIFQTSALLPTYTALENIDLALRLRRLSRRERRERAYAMLDNVQLRAKAHNMAEQLSGGERQRIAIARALALRPRIVLADEPTNNLDSRTTKVILALFREIARTQATTFLIVSHEPAIVEYVDTIYHLRDGQLMRAQR